MNQTEGREKWKRHFSGPGGPQDIGLQGQAGCGDKPLLTSSRSWRPFSFSPPEVWLAVHQGTQGDAHSIVTLGSMQGPRQAGRAPFPSLPPQGGCQAWGSHPAGR